MPALFEWLGIGGSVDAGTVALLRSLLTGAERELPPGATDVVEIPPGSSIASTDSFFQRTTLDGYEYTFLFDWNERSEAWHMSIFDVDENALLENKKIVVEQDLLHALPIENRPPGAIICYEISGALTRLTRESFGVTHRLCYVT